MQPFLNPYELPPKTEFPFIICVIGPPGSGRTTVCQFLRLLFDVHVLDCLQLPPPPKGKPPPDSLTEPPPVEAPLLSDAIAIRYRDDKSCLVQILDAIRARRSDGKGYVISGYPFQKAQFAALEKGLTAANLTMLPEQMKFLPPLSARVKAQLPSINGAIFTTSTENPHEKLIDPETGSVYSRDFCLPSVPDFIGAVPMFFGNTKEEIAGRLIEFVPPAYPAVAPKTLQTLVAFEQQLKKSIVTTVIGHCESAKELLEAVDAFIVELYDKNPQYLASKAPFATLLKAPDLVRPGHCFTAISTWYRCLEAFGRTIADQSNLVSTLASKLDLLIKAATDRYQLVVARKDDRLKLCGEFRPATDRDWSDHFRRIWEMSIAVRNANFDLVDEVVDKSGLIELLLELRTSAKIVFIALVHRLAYVKWFVERFGPVMSGDPPESDSFDDQPPAAPVEIPVINYRSPTPILPLVFTLSEPEIGSAGPSRATLTPLVGAKPFAYTAHRPARTDSVRPSVSIGVEERKMMAGVLGFEYLIKNMTIRTERPPDEIYFDVRRACADLQLLPFEPKEITFDDTIQYADGFFAHVAQVSSIPLLVAEAKTMVEIFNKFTVLCHKKETSMVNTVFDLRDALVKYTYAKCTKEMETFTDRFRRSKQGEIVSEPPFEFDVQSVGPRVQKFAQFLTGLDNPITIQSLVSMETIVKVASEIMVRGLEFASEHDFIEVVRRVCGDPEEAERLEICLRVMECVEKFDSQKFLLAFARSKEDEAQLAELFTKRRIRRTLMSVSMMLQSRTSSTIKPPENRGTRSEPLLADIQKAVDEIVESEQTV
jgi:hypothetical protein